MREGWREVRLGEVATCNTSAVPTSSVDLPYIGLEHFDSGSPRIERWARTSDMEGSGIPVRAGDVLFSKLRPYLRKVAVAEAEALCSTEVLVWRTSDAVSTDQTFLSLVLRSDQAIDFANSRATGTRMPRTSVKGMSALPITLPPLDEQRRIVDLIAAVDDAIEAAEREVNSLGKSLDAMRRSRIEYAEDKVDFQQVVTLQRGFDLPVSSRRNGDVVVMSSSGPHGFHDETPVVAPGVVTGRSGTIGMVHYSERPFWPLNTALWVSDFHGNDPKYVRYLLQSMHLEEHAGGSTVPSLNRNVLSKVQVHMPPLAAQKQIVEQLEAVEDSIDTARATADSLKTLRSNLLTVLLSGEHEIPESYDQFLNLDDATGSTAA